ncbi:MAG: stage II sporulation protein M [Nitrosopumilaceae archaeon]
MMRKKRLLILLIFIGIFLASFSIGVEIPVSDDEAKAFAEEFNRAIEGIDALGIFRHNVSIALPMFIPGAGVAWGAFAAAQTGQAFTALVITYPALSTIPPLSLLLISPFGLMELVAYSIGMSRSFLLIQTIIKKNPLKQEIRPIAIEIGIAIALLIAGGVIEYAMIQQFGSDL